MEKTSAQGWFPAGEREIEYGALNNASESTVRERVAQGRAMCHKCCRSLFYSHRPVDNRSTAVNSQRVVFLLLVPVASFTLWAFHHARHRCPHADPLCKRDRPCIACYRAIFKSTVV